jgi:hypothetical protein
MVWKKKLPLSKWVASGACVKAKSQNGSKASTTASGDPMESDLEQFRMLTRGGSRVDGRVQANARAHGLAQGVSRFQGRQSVTRP